MRGEIMINSISEIINIIPILFISGCVLSFLCPEFNSVIRNPPSKIFYQFDVLGKYQKPLKGVLCKCSG